MEELLNELKSFFLKIFLPAFVAITIKIATQMKYEKFKFSKILISFISGISCAYFTYPFIGHDVPEKYVPLFVGMVAMSGEKIAEYILYKLDLETFFDIIVNFLKGKK